MRSERKKGPVVNGFFFYLLGFWLDSLVIASNRFAEFLKKTGQRGLHMIPIGDER